MSSKRSWLKALATGAIMAITVPSFAQQATSVDVPRSLSYQGMITNKGDPADGDFKLTVTLYGDAQGKQPIWTNEYTTHITNGVFNVLLGDETHPLPNSAEIDKPMWVGASINGGPELRPLNQVASTAYALNVSNNAITANKLAPGAVTADKLNVDYVSAVTVDGQQITSKGDPLNLVSGNGIEFRYDPTTKQVHAGTADPLKHNGVSDYWGESGNSAIPAGSYVGTSDNAALEIHVYGLRVMDYVPTLSLSTTPNIIGGYSGNTIAGNAYGAVIAGGGSPGAGNNNTIPSSFVYPNSWEGDLAVIGGGSGNTALSPGSTVGGGVNNTAGSSLDVSSKYQTVAGGYINTASGDDAVIGGGEFNTASGYESVVAGGSNNKALGQKSFVGGGGDGSKSTNANSAENTWSAVVGGHNNHSKGDYGIIGGGDGNTLTGSYSIIGGGSSNQVSGLNSVVSGGYNNNATGKYSSIGGGSGNTVTDYSFVGGGSSNSGSNTFSTVAGGSSNTASGDHSTVAGGIINSATSSYSYVGGGNSNTAGGQYSTVGGGIYNTAGSSGVVGGGGYNNTTGSTATVGGGYQNGAAGDYSTIPGGTYLSTIAREQTAVGLWNDPGQISGNTPPNDAKLFMIGNGTSSLRGNAFEVSYNGHATVTDVNGSSYGAGRAPYKGASYVDNTIAAWGIVTVPGNYNLIVTPPGSTPNIKSTTPPGAVIDFGVSQILWMGAGYYDVTLANRLNPGQSPVKSGTDPSYPLPNGAVIVTPIYDSIAHSCYFFSASPVSNGHFTVHITSGQSADYCKETDCSFMFTVVGR